MQGPRKTAIVIGGGVGGLAAAIHLQRAGLKVRLLERSAHLGGKLRELEVGGWRFPAGPSVFTMRPVFEELFGGALERYVELMPVDPLCRHFFSDGVRLDLYTDVERSRAAIADFAGASDADAYVAYRKRAAKIHEIVRGPFMERAIPSAFEFMSPKALIGMAQIDAMRTLWRALEETFSDPRLRQLFGRYATYNGSSPFHAPATLSVIAHVENAYGVWACRGGIYRLAEALARLAGELGVEIQTGCDVDGLIVERDRVAGARVRGGTERADVVVANCDVAHLYERLLDGVPQVARLRDKYAREELSLSAFVLLCAGRRAPLPLLHHNVFFSGDYRREFDELVEERRPPDDPTVYLCAVDRGEGAPEAAVERCFFLTNAPPRDARGQAIDWALEGPRCRARIAAVLARFGWTLESEAETTLTPEAYEAAFPSSRGALYGLSSNSRWAAFKRPPNKLPGLRNLYLAGGTVHPGAGLPMVCLSARIASQLAVAELS